MALSRERFTGVPQVETSLFPFSDKPTARIAHAEALDSKKVADNLRPNVVADVDIQGHPWSVTAVLSPYATGFHVMTVDLSDRYVPDPRFLSADEGSELMATCGKIVDFQERLPNTTTVSVGYNCSPRSYGAEEEKGGLQSLTTKWHIQLWNQPEATQRVPLDSLKEGTRRAILGNGLNRVFGMMVKENIFKELSFGKFLDLNNVDVDNRGIEVPVNGSLREVFAMPGFFAEFLKPLAVKLDAMARDMTETFSDMDNPRIEELIKGEFERGTNGILPALREDPHLLPYDERIRRIRQLEGKGYGPRDMRLLRGLNVFVRGRQQVSEDKWIRKGLGYALVFSQDLATGKTKMRLMPGVLVSERGGVVEALGVALYRRETVDPHQAEKDEEKRRVLRQLGAYLQNSV